MQTLADAWVVKDGKTEMEQRITHRAFTVVELMAVMLILGVATAIAIPSYLASQRAANLSACQANMIAIHQAEETMRMRSREYTNDLANLSQTLGGTPKCPADKTSNPSYTLEVDNASALPSLRIVCNGEHSQDPVYVNGSFESPGSKGQP